MYFLIKKRGPNNEVVLDQPSNMPAARSKFRRVKCNDMTGVALVG